MNSKVPVRAMALVSLLENRDRNSLRGAEIGVLRGEMSAALLEHMPQLFLYMVDTWTSADRDSTYYRTRDSASRLSQDTHDLHLECARKATTFAADRRVVIRATSVVAASAVAEHSLDFVFIDADHSYEGVRTDIHTWWPKLRQGGYLTGHDFGGRKNRMGRCGVDLAVLEFAHKQRLPVMTGPDHVWWIRKPAGKSLTSSGTIIRLLTNVERSPSFQAAVARTFVSTWARETIRYFVLQERDADWLVSLGARHVDVVQPSDPQPQLAHSPLMKPWLLRQAWDRVGEFIFVDFECRVPRIPDSRCWEALRLQALLQESDLLAVTVQDHKPSTDSETVQPQRQGKLSTAVLYCAGTHWLDTWIKAVIARNCGKVNSDDAADYLMGAVQQELNSATPDTLVNRFENPVATASNATIEGAKSKVGRRIYFRCPVTKAGLKRSRIRI